MVGLVLYATGTLLFYPAARYEAFGFFLISLYILTFGLAFLETTANPFILSMGDEETSTRRLNLAQSFNPMGSLLGMFVASNVVLVALESDKRDSLGNLIFPTLDAAQKAIIRTSDLAIIRNPYVMLGFVVLIMLVIITVTKMPDRANANHEVRTREIIARLLKKPVYREGVIAQMFYVSAQIMCWTFIIQYAENLGIDKSTAQKYNIIAMGIFLSSRFISTFLMKFINSKRLLFYFAIGGMITMTGTIFIQGMNGLYCLIATSAFMSLMFPTIYGIALHGIGDDSTIGAAGLVMAIVGGALMPPLQGAIIDFGTIAGLPAVNFSFILPFICFVAVAIFAYRTIRKARTIA
jgi:FHS family L-fucose permease-like MFS transporter